MKIDFEGVTRVLDLQHVKLRHAVVIQEYTGLAVYAWQERVAGVSALDGAAAGPVTLAEGDRAALVEVLRKAPMYADPTWILTLAAAHWLMLAQAGESPPPLDDDYDLEVFDFHLALLTALGEEVKAKRVPDKPGPPARPARRTPSSRQTGPPKRPIPVVSLELSSPTGS